MKYIIVLGDGMADEPIPSLGGRTPIQAGFLYWLQREKAS